MRFGDVLVVHDPIRFDRNKEEIRNEWIMLIEEEIDIVVMSMPMLDTRKYKSRRNGAFGFRYCFDTSFMDGRRMLLAIN